MSDPICSYASKYGAAMIGGMVRYAELEPSKKDEAMLIASLALYRAEGKSVDLEKAKALGDTMTRV